MFMEVLVKIHLYSCLVLIGKLFLLSLSSSSLLESSRLLERE